MPTPKLTREEFDAPRRLVLERSKALGLTLADLSRGLERNPTYFHQYLYRGSPKVLPEDVRIHLAELLAVDESALRGVPTPRKGPEKPAGHPTLQPRRPLMTGLSPSNISQTELIPIFSEKDALIGNSATAWMPRPPAFNNIQGGFAIWISRYHGRRLSPGDIAYVHPTQPARVGDAAVIVRNDEVVAIGDLEEQPADAICLTTEVGKHVKFALDGHQIMRVALIQLG